MSAEVVEKSASAAGAKGDAKGVDKGVDKSVLEAKTQDV